MQQHTIGTERRRQVRQLIQYLHEEWGIIGENGLVHVSRGKTIGNARV